MFCEIFGGQCPSIRSEHLLFSPLVSCRIAAPVPVVPERNAFAVAKSTEEKNSSQGKNDASVDQRKTSLHRTGFQSENERLGVCHAIEFRDVGFDEPADRRFLHFARSIVRFLSESLSWIRRVVVAKHFPRLD